MSSTPRHHAEWLSLLEISGPFLSMPVLLDAFPNGLDALDSSKMGSLRAAYEEWADNQGSLKPDPAIHSAWVHFVLSEALEYDSRVLLAGQAIPAGLKTSFPEYGETLRPDLALVEPKTQKPRLLIQIFPPAQALDQSVHASRWQASVATRMMELLHATNTRLGLITNGEHWMLVDAPAGETTGFISWYAPLWFEEPLTLRAFTTLLGLRRFFGVPDAETLEALLSRSAQDQHEVTNQLGYQVRSAVEILIRSLDQADQDRGRLLLADLAPDLLYEAALTVMMRLVFLMSAEERKLLPLDDPFYAQNYAVSTLRAQLREQADQTGEEVLERSYDAWCRLLAAFRVVFGGINHDRLKLMAYGGSLFDPDRFPFLEGRPPQSRWVDTPAAPLPVNNRTVLHLLEALQILRVAVPGGGPKEARRLSFRALDIEQIGHVYEGLLDHIAMRAAEPTLGLSGAKDKEPEIPLSQLEQLRLQGPDPLLAFLQEQSGRSRSALEKALKAQPDAWEQARLLRACGNQDALYNRVLPFAGLVRADDYGGKVVIPANSLYVTQGSTRRATGTHYTPRSLTEPIVQHTLEPLVYAGPAEGLPKEQWQLRSPRELLELKVCDMAMGSGAFLVQACRYLSERLVEAWGQTLSAQPTPVAYITPEGRLTANPDQAIPVGDEDRLILAKRLVADRCLYGVDKNPLAVEMAKLSLWLITLDQNRAFTFLNHALKCGDSLVGADEALYRRWAYSLKGAQFTLYLTTLEEMVTAARRKRQELESFIVLDVHDADHKAQLLAEADQAMARVKLGCDLLMGVRLLGLKDKDQEDLLARLLWDYVAGEPMESLDAQRALNAARKERAFHWPFEFPEVFEKGGFSAFVGNPPFLGGQRISTSLGDGYLFLLRDRYPSSTGTADLCAFFFLRGYNLLLENGIAGLIATNTIAQGDTRTTGLDQIIKVGGTIYQASASTFWPGEASVSVSIVNFFKGSWRGEKLLENMKVNTITSFLDDIERTGNPQKLVNNSNKSFIGSYVLGMGFILDAVEMQFLLEKSPHNANVIMPYLIGEDLNSRPDQSPSRWVINFFNWPLEKAEKYPECLERIRQLVKPERDKVKRDRNRNLWWLYAENRPGLYFAISKLNKVIVCSRVTHHLSFSLIKTNIVFSDRLVVFAFDELDLFAILSSNLHEIWTRKYSSTLETRLLYAPSDCFETFPFPKLPSTILNPIGDSYNQYRQQIMLARQEGLTVTYNRLHNPKEKSTDIIHLRDLQVKMDNAVAVAYGWNDVNLEHDFHETPQGLRFTISEPARREVLARLLRLNHECYEEEVKAGLHEKEKKGATKVKSAPPEIKNPTRHHIKEQPGLFYDPTPTVEPEIRSAPVQESPTPIDQIGVWDQCVCLGCGKHLAGFSVAEHTQAVHQGQDPGYRKVK
jgi:hypothetical protein